MNLLHPLSPTEPIHLQPRSPAAVPAFFNIWGASRAR